MPRYHIEIPYTGKIVIELQAESEEAALELIYNTQKDDLEKLDCVDYAEFEEDYHKQVVEGNVFNGILNRRFIKELPDDEE